MGSDHTPADDIVYDLVSVQYHALQAGYTYGKYLQDAEGHSDSSAFIEARSFPHAASSATIAW